MDSKLLTYTTKLDKCKVSFYLPNGRLTNYIHIDNKISPRDLNLRQIKLIISLNLLFTSFTGCIITSSGLTFLTYPSLPFTSECTENGGGSPLHPLSCVPCCNSCNNNTRTVLDNNTKTALEDDFPIAAHI